MGHRSTWRPHEEDTPGSTQSPRYRRKGFITLSLCPMRLLSRCGVWKVMMMISCDASILQDPTSVNLYRLLVFLYSPSKVPVGVQQPIVHLLFASCSKL